MSKQHRPTDGELEILRVLWREGPSTVRDVHGILSKTKPGTGYTTVLKLMQIMSEKDLVSRDEKNKAHVYSPRIREDQTQKQLVGDLLDRVFGGSAARMVMQALASKKANPQELAEIRHMLDEFEQDEFKQTGGA